MESKIEVIQCTDPGELYRQLRKFPEEPQPVYVYLDLENAVMWAAAATEFDNGKPREVWEQRCLRWRIPLVTAEEANFIMEKILPSAEKALQGWSLKWNGEFHQGVLDEEANKAVVQIGKEIDTWLPEGLLEVVDPWTAVDTDLVGPDDSDEELEDLAEKIRQDALRGDPVAVIPGRELLRALHELREEQRAERGWRGGMEAHHAW